MAQNNIADLVAKLSAEELEALLTQVSESKKPVSEADKRRSQYAEALVPAITQVIEHEKYTESDKSDWAGYSVRQIKVTIEGHTFTVGVTITDDAKKAERETARKVAEARALLGVAAE